MRRYFAILLALAVCGIAAIACAESADAGGHLLTRLAFSRWGEMRPRSWEVVWEGDGCTIREDDGDPRPLAANLAEELRQVVAEYDMESWKGVYSTVYEVLDGECFSLEMAFSDGVKLSASGDNAFPDRYVEATGALDDIFQREKAASLAGTYRYEGEGFGGDFTITLNGDGSYTFYEGPLSSYIGMGSWYTAWDAVYMSEGDAGYDLSFTFGVEGDALIYLAGGSDAFLYVELPDGARFIRLDP